MKSYARLVKCFAVCCFFLYSMPAAGVSAPEPAYRETQWAELVPESWHPEKLFEGLDLDSVSDSDPRVQKIFEAFMEEWKNAPANEKMDGQLIKIPGFIAPLDWEGDTELKEFLLVPYFGACIHLPPPPPNQIIYVKLEKPLKGLRAMDTIWAYGTISIEKNDSGSMGASGYSMKVDKVESYQ